MPYITPVDREVVDGPIKNLVDAIESFSEDEIDGVMNYCISKLVFKVYCRKLKYRILNRMVGVLACVQQEIYRRVVADYEDTKIEANGEVFK